MRFPVTLLQSITASSVFCHAFNLWGGSSKALDIHERASIWGLPNCASTCVTSSFGGCSTIDVACICKNKDFIENLGCCISKACDEEEQDAAIQFADNFCSPYKVTNLPTAATCPPSAAATTRGATTSKPTLDPSSPTSLLPALSSAASAALANVTNGTISVSIRNVTVTATVTATSSQSQNGAAGIAEVTGWAWGMGAVLVGAAAVVV